MATLEATELAAAEFARRFEATARALGYSVERFAYAPPALSVLRFPARHKAVILAGCWYLGHDCVLGRQCVSLPSGVPDPAAMWETAFRARQSLAERLAVEGYSPAVTVWQCSRMTMMRTMRFIRELLEPLKNGERRPLI